MSAPQAMTKLIPASRGMRRLHKTRRLLNACQTGPDRAASQARPAASTTSTPAAISTRKPPRPARRAGSGSCPCGIPVWAGRTDTPGAAAIPGEADRGGGGGEDGIGTPALEDPDGAGMEDDTGGGTRGAEGGGSEDSMVLSGPALGYHDKGCCIKLCLLASTGIWRNGRTVIRQPQRHQHDLMIAPIFSQKRTAQSEVARGSPDHQRHPLGQCSRLRQ
jgi:hypothetical protein